MNSARNNTNQMKAMTEARDAAKARYDATGDENAYLAFELMGGYINAVLEGRYA